MFLVGLVGSHTILRSYMILHDPMYDPIIFTILNVLVKWDSKIMRSYDPDRDFDNYASHHSSSSPSNLLNISHTFSLS